MTTRAVIVTKDWTYRNGRKLARTPEHALTGGVVAFLTAVAAMLDGSGVLMISRAAAAALGLPTGSLPTGPAARHNPTVVKLRSAGWHIKEVHRWFRVKRGDQEIHIGLDEFIDAGYMPFRDARAHETVAGLAAWHEWTGVPWRGDAGDAGNAILRQVGKMKHDGKIIEPTWWDKNGPDGSPRELPYTPARWSRQDDPRPRFELGFDRYRAYLGAMMCTEVAGFGLRRNTDLTFRKDRAGWWLVKVAPWMYAHLMPDPAGYGREDEQGRRWLTTPRLVLLDQLVQEGKHGGFEVLDAWTAPAKADILKPYAVKLRDLWEAAGGSEPGPVGQLVQAAVKESFRMAHGKWASDRSDVKRPDWSAALVATAAANTWRKAWKVGTKLNIWPLRIDTDNTWYASDTDDHAALARVFDKAISAPGRHEFELADRLGGFRPGGVRDVSRETSAVPA